MPSTMCWQQRDMRSTVAAVEMWTCHRRRHCYLRHWPIVRMRANVLQQRMPATVLIERRTTSFANDSIPAYGQCLYSAAMEQRQKKKELTLEQHKQEEEEKDCSLIVDSLTYHLEHIALLGHNVQREHRWRLLDHRHNGAVGNASDRRVVHH